MPHQRGRLFRHAARYNHGLRQDGKRRHTAESPVKTREQATDIALRKRRIRREPCGLFCLSCKKFMQFREARTGKHMPCRGHHRAVARKKSRKSTLFPIPHIKGEGHMTGFGSDDPRPSFLSAGDEPCRPQASPSPDYGNGHISAEGRNSRPLTRKDGFRFRQDRRKAGPGLSFKIIHQQSTGIRKEILQLLFLHGKGSIGHFYTPVAHWAGSREYYRRHAGKFRPFHRPAGEKPAQQGRELVFSGRYDYAAAPDRLFVLNGKQGKTAVGSADVGNEHVHKASSAVFAR